MLGKVITVNGEDYEKSFLWCSKMSHYTLRYCILLYSHARMREYEYLQSNSKGSHIFSRISFSISSMAFCAKCLSNDLVWNLVTVIFVNVHRRSHHINMYLSYVYLTYTKFGCNSSLSFLYYALDNVKDTEVLAVRQLLDKGYRRLHPNPSN